MSQYIITLKKGASDEDVEALKKDIVASGGSIKHNHTLFKGVTATIPGVHTDVLKKHDPIDTVEAD